MKKILIVEDDQTVAKALGIRMKSAGYDIALAADAIQAISVAAAFSPDLIMLDMNLPAGNGIDVAHCLRRILPPAIPIIFLTASKMPGLVDRAANIAPPVSYLEKPYDPQTLLTVTRRELRET